MNETTFVYIIIINVLAIAMIASIFIRKYIPTSLLVIPREWLEICEVYG
jgi:hypothetical protein